jgi:glucose/arabinose dehydrogenase
MRAWPGLIAMAMLTACGGGGTGGGLAPPTNRAPIFTSASTATVAENFTGIAYQATATDPDGNAITFTLAGTDAGRFTLSAGAISFATPPDFEVPLDADRDNVYSIQLQASDGQATTTINVVITVTNVAETATRQVGAFSSPTYVAAIPGSARVFVSEKDGDVFLLDPAGTGSSSLYLTISGIRADLTNYGLLGVAPAPDYVTSGLLYAFVTNTAGDIEIRRYGRAGSGLGDPAGDVILRIPRVSPTPRSGTNNGGWIGFGADGLLYVAVGDGGEPLGLGGTRLTTAQDRSSLRGKLLRLDVSRDAFPANLERDYAIPATNPFVGMAGAPEILAYGFQNPERASFDGSVVLVNDYNRSPTGSAFGDAQEVNLLRPQDWGGNFGYPYLVGLDGTGITPVPPGLTAPVVIYRGATLNRIGHVAGGQVYRGPAVQFQGLYIFTDKVDSRIRSVPASSLIQGATLGESSLANITATLFPGPEVFVEDLGQDSAGNLFFVLNDGRIFMLDVR